MLIGHVEHDLLHSAMFSDVAAAQHHLTLGFIDIREVRLCEVEEAIRVLNAAEANLLGIILTNREYFIPEWLYKRV